MNADYKPVQENKNAQILTAAGVRYPLYWDELGSSEKDLWEERAVRRLHRTEQLQKGASHAGR